MKKYKEHKKKKPFDRVFILFFMVFFFGVVAFSVTQQMLAFHKLKQEDAAVMAEIKQEQEKNIQHKNDKEYYNSDEYIEQTAREQLGMVKSNEVLYVDRTK